MICLTVQRETSKELTYTFYYGLEGVKDTEMPFFLLLDRCRYYDGLFYILFYVCKTEHSYQSFKKIIYPILTGTMYYFTHIVKICIMKTTLIIQICLS